MGGAATVVSPAPAAPSSRPMSTSPSVPAAGAGGLAPSVVPADAVPSQRGVDAGCAGAGCVTSALISTSPSGSCCVESTRTPPSPAVVATVASAVAAVELSGPGAAVADDVDAGSAAGAAPVDGVAPAPVATVVSGATVVEAVAAATTAFGAVDAWATVEALPCAVTAAPTSACDTTAVDPEEPVAADGTLSPPCLAFFAGEGVGSSDVKSMYTVPKRRPTSKSSLSS